MTSECFIKTWNVTIYGYYSMEISADVVYFRPKEVHNGTKPKSAPCTPCGNRDVNFDVDAVSYTHLTLPTNREV